MDYDESYRSGTAPWEIGAVQPALAAVLDSGAVRGPAVLDAGCGTGELAIALARRGLRVTAVDLSAVAVEQARAKAGDLPADVPIDFRVADATTLTGGPFDAIVDSGLLHNLQRHGGADDYLALLPRLAAPGATVFVLAISAAAGHGWGLTEEYLRAAFAAPAWTGTRVDRVEITATVGVLPGLLTSTVRAGA